MDFQDGGQTDKLGLLVLYGYPDLAARAGKNLSLR